MPGYNMAVAQIGHELGHRWSTRTRAIVNGETIELRGPHDPWGMSGATHWPASVSTPVPFPFSRPVEASIMGGVNWKDNGDGTFTQLANGTMNPASGFSYLELYLMGFLPASKVPDFFILRNQKNVGRTPEGQNIVAADKTADHDSGRHRAQRTARAVVRGFTEGVQHRAWSPSRLRVVSRAPRCSPSWRASVTAWIGYWAKVTGGVSTMSTSSGRTP